MITETYKGHTITIWDAMDPEDAKVWKPGKRGRYKITVQKPNGRRDSYHDNGYVEIVLLMKTFIDGAKEKA